MGKKYNSRRRKGKGKRQVGSKVKKEVKREMNIDDIPMDVLVDIFCRLPAKSVWRLRSVCKDWKSLIESPSFADLHLLRSKKICFMVWRFDSRGQENFNYRSRFYSIDKENAKAVRVVREELAHPNLMTTSIINGLICYIGTDMLIHVWNPVTHELITLPKPTFFLSFPPETMYYFPPIVMGFDSTAKTYKVLVVKDTNFSESEIFVLGRKTKCWRKVKTSLVERAFIHDGLYAKGVYANGCFYWLTLEFYERVNERSALISFNFAEEKFELVPLPADIDSSSRHNKLCEVGGCLCLVEWKKSEKKEITRLRMLPNSGTQAWVDQHITLPPFEKILSVYPVSSGLIFLRVYENGRYKKYMCSYSKEGQFLNSVVVRGIPNDFDLKELHAESVVSLRSILAAAAGS